MKAEPSLNAEYLLCGDVEESLLVRQEGVHEVVLRACSKKQDTKFQ